jgi:hypothetical protein
MSSSENITCKKRDFAAGVFLSEAQNPISPPLHTIRVNTSTLGRWGGGRFEPERRGEGQQFTKLGRKYQHD